MDRQQATYAALKDRYAIGEPDYVYDSLARCETELGCHPDHLLDAHAGDPRRGRDAFRGALCEGSHAPLLTRMNEEARSKRDWKRPALRAARPCGRAAGLRPGENKTIEHRRSNCKSRVTVKGSDGVPPNLSETQVKSGVWPTASPSVTSKARRLERAAHAPARASASQADGSPWTPRRRPCRPSGVSVSG